MKNYANKYINNHLHHTLLLLLTVCAFNVQASDLAREQRWANEVVDAIVDGEAVELNDGDHNFLGIYTEANKTSPRAAIVLHGTGVHPNWQQVVHPLRTGLTEHGWNTLSIQMPILDNEADHNAYAVLYPDEVPARINAAINFLHDKGIKQIVLVGHSQGAIMAAYYLSKHSKDIRALAAVGMSCNLSEPSMNAANSLKSIHMPILDVYGSEDIESVLKYKSACVDAAKTAGNKAYSKKVVADANHFFDGKDKELVKIVSDWLNALPK